VSFEAIAAVLHHSQASVGAKLVLTIVANFDREEGAWCSQKTIGRLANISERQVRRYLKELDDLGELQIWVHEGYSAGGIRPTNRYYITLECPENCDGSFNHKAVTSDLVGGQIRPLRRTLLTDKADTSDLQTSKEPIKNLYLTKSS
jgi:hypothetical protein